MKAILQTALALCAALQPLTATAESLLITNLTVTPSDVQIDWNAASNLYIVAQSPSLTTGATAYVGSVVATNSSTVSNDIATGFYRIREVEVVTFPDPNFESAVRLNIPHKYAPSNQVYDIDMEPITMLNASSADVTSTVGIAWMPALTNLNCAENALPALDVSMLPMLTVLKCTWNQLTNLSVQSNTRLEGLWCDKNQLTHLDLSSNRVMTLLNCSHNSLTNLITPAHGSLTALYCIDTQLTTLDISGNTNLTIVWAIENPLLTEIVVWDTNSLPAEFNCDDGTPWIHEP